MKNKYTPSFNLKGQVAVGFGGTSGIGKAIALGLAESEAHVIPIGRRKSLTKKTVKEINFLKRDSLEISIDVADTTALQHVAKTVYKKFNSIDIMVCSAGTHLKKPSVGGGHLASGKY